MPDYVLSFITGALGAALLYAGLRLTDVRERLRTRFRTQNEQVLALVHHLVDLKNQEMLVEAELAELLEREPPDRARWFARMRELAGVLPPVVLAQLRRFGLAEPPPEQPLVEIPRRETGSVPSSPAPAESPARENVVAIDAWTGRSR